MRKPRFREKIYCLKSLKNLDAPIEGYHRWTIYIIGILEAFVFGGCIFGWSQLVYVLKNEEIFLDLCQTTELNISSADNTSQSIEDLKLDLKLLGCKEQDKEFALVYNISLLSFALVSFITGILLHNFGLVLTRISASLFLLSGFTFLAMTSKDESYWLYVSMVLLGFGGNQLQLCGLQFCNLFPKYRSTALTIISGSFAASAGVFIVYQICQYIGINHVFVSASFGTISFISLIATMVMPWHHIPYNDVPQPSFPLKESVFSVSSFFYIFWFSMQITGSTFYAMYFNPWISKIAETNEMAGVYSLLFSITSFASFFVSPFPGLINDYLLKKAAEAPNTEERLIREMKCPALTLFSVTIINIGTLSCLLFDNAISIYLSLIGRSILRSSLVAVGTSFLRLRFPAEHFDRLNGICGTVAAFFLLIQYPLFIWAQENFHLTMACLIGLVLSTCVHPLHLLSMNYRRKVVTQKLKYSLMDKNLPKNKVDIVSASNENIQSIYNPKDVKEVDGIVPNLFPLSQDENKDQNSLNVENANDEIALNADNDLKSDVSELMLIEDKLSLNDLGSNNSENSESNKGVDEENSEKGQKYTVERH